MIGAGKQSAAGAGVAAVWWNPWTAIALFNPVIKREVYRDGTNREIVFDAKLGEWYQFDFTTQLRPSAGAQLLAYFMGATDTSSHLTGTMSATTLTGAGNTAGSTSITVAATANAAVGDVLLITNVGGAVLSEYVQVKTVTSGTVLALQTPLMNSYLASSTLVNAGSAAMYAHSGANANVNLPVLSFWHSIGNGGAGGNPLDTVQVVDCIISDWAVTSPAGSLATLNIKGMGKIGTPGQSNQTVSYETDRQFTFADATMNIVGLTVTGNAADLTRFVGAGKNTITQVPVHSTIVPQLYNADRTITVDFDIFAEDNKVWRDVFWGSDAGTTYSNSNTIASQLAIRWDYATAAPDHFMQLYFSNVVLEDAKPKFDVNAAPFMFTVKGTAKNKAAIGAGQTALIYLIATADTAAY